MWTTPELALPLQTSAPHQTPTSCYQDLHPFG
ncbi:hypothetical protein AVEN_117334-1, partial [Araneus ventricosus]